MEDSDKSENKISSRSVTLSEEFDLGESVASSSALRRNYTEKFDVVTERESMKYAHSLSILTLNTKTPRMTLFAEQSCSQRCKTDQVRLGHI